MLEAVLFYGLAAVVLGLALVVITRTNPLAGALALVGALAALAGLYAVLWAGFLAAVQVLVYAGGIMVLMVFVIMLLDLRAPDLAPLKARSATVVLALLAGLGTALAPLLTAAFDLWDWGGATPEDGFGGIASLGKGLFTVHLFPFEMLSFLLLAAVVGAVVLSKKKL